MHITIVEDQAEERERLQAFTEKYCAAHQLAAQLCLYPDGDSFLQHYALDPHPDLIFMDIEMPGKSGMETARKLRELDPQVPLIFITYMVQFALEGYSVDAADFIPKPVTYASFSAHLDRQLGKIRAGAPRFLQTSYAKQPLSLRIQHICYIESLHKKTIIHDIDGETHYSSEPLYALEEKLSDEPFFRCHNGYLVNLAHVKRMDSANVFMPNDALPLSKYRKKEFMQTLAAYRGRML